jgi:hypothetical protein
MKNLAKSVFATALLAVVLTSSVSTTFAAEPVTPVTTSASASSFNRIWVSGNVKIILTQGDAQSVVGTDNYNKSKTSVTSSGQTLYVNSLEKGQVTLNITVKDLQRVEAYGQSVVVTSNNFDVKNLQLFLGQTANVKIKTTAKSLYTIVKDDAVLKLNGTADQSTLVASNLKNIKSGDFSCKKSESYASEAIMNADQTAMTISK